MIDNSLDILTLGEALVDLISIERGASLNDVDSFKRYLGGSPINVAATAVRLGRRATVAARVGDDAFGRFVRAEMLRLGLDDDNLQVDGEHVTSLVFVTSTTGSPDFLPVRGADYFLAFDHSADQRGVALNEALHAMRALHVTSWPLSREPVRTTALAAIRQAHAEGKLVSLDPNYRARLWPAPEEVHPLLRELLPLTTLCKPSLDDAVAIFGAGLSPQAYVARFHDYGAPNILLTMGKDGVLVSNGTTLTPLLAEPIEIVDATGAGDAFTTGALLALIDGLDLVTAARIGQAVASAKLRGIGHGATLPSWTTLIKNFEF